MPDPFPLRHLCGWLGADPIQKAFARSMPTLRQAAPHLFGAPPQTEPVMLYRAWVDVLGKYPDYPAQKIGDCVSFGHGHGNDLLQCIEKALGGDLAYQETDTEFLYGAARELAGILSAEDGCYGAAAVKAMTTVGLVSRPMLEGDGVYSGDRAKKWGLTGPPRALETRAANYRLGGGAKVETWEGLTAAIANGYPVTICTDRGWTLTRDSQGFCAPDGQWGHCMLIAGVRFDRPGACVMQSWGPDLPSGPMALDQPSWSFWTDRSVIETVLAEGDSWALSRSANFAAKILPCWTYGDAA